MWNSACGMENQNNRTAEVQNIREQKAEKPNNMSSKNRTAESPKLSKRIEKREMVPVNEKM